LVLITTRCTQVHVHALDIEFKEDKLSFERLWNFFNEWRKRLGGDKREARHPRLRELKTVK
jgi:hypothetical protein